MTKASVEDEKICGVHHVPRSKCPPDAAHTRTVRFPDRAWDGAVKAAGQASALIVPATEAFLGYAGCPRCDAPVPLRSGDLTGMTLPEAYEQARKQVRHPDHEAVWLGAEPALPVPADDLAGQMAGLQDMLGQVQAHLGGGRAGRAAGDIHFVAPAVNP